MLLSEAHIPLSHSITVPEPSLCQAVGSDPVTKTLSLPSGDSQLSPKADKKTARRQVRGFCDRREAEGLRDPGALPEAL